MQHPAPQNPSDTSENTEEKTEQENQSNDSSASQSNDSSASPANDSSASQSNDSSASQSNDSSASHAPKGSALVIHTSLRAVQKVKPHAVSLIKHSKSQIRSLYNRVVTEEVYGPYCARALEWVDRAGRFMGDPKGDEQRDEVMQMARTPIVFGVWVIILIFGFFGMWATLAPLDSAAVARGIVVLDSSKKTIQHLEGGIISQILVREGDKVQAGQVLVKLSETGAKSRLDTLKGQLNASLALESRLIAERDEATEITFNPTLLAQQQDPEIQKIIDTQTRIFATRRESLEGKINVLKQQIAESNEEIGGLAAQEEASESQMQLIRDEIAIVKQLLENGNANKPRLLALQRREVELRGLKGQYTAQIAKAKQNIGEAEMQIMNTKTLLLNDVMKELRDTQVTIADLQEKVKAGQDIVDRLDITAPYAGVINNLAYHTIGGVIAPGNPVLEIVPLDDKLVIDAQVLPQDIDVVHVGLKARVRLTAFRARTTPVIEGKVVNVSADRLIDKANNAAYYLARVEVDKEMLSKLEDVELYPGMPADVLIVTGTRTFMGYLMSPLTDSFRHAFREQ